MPSVTDKLTYSAMSLVPFFVVFWGFLAVMSAASVIDVDRKFSLVKWGVVAHIVFFGLIFGAMFIEIGGDKDGKKK